MASDGDCAFRFAAPIASFRRFSREHEAPSRDSRRYPLRQTRFLFSPNSEGERGWIKARDQGATFYVSLFPQTEREQRRLQFMGDVNAARIEQLSEGSE